MIAKVEEYARIVAAREKTREAFRSESLALMQQSMQQTQGMVARIMQQANDTFEAGQPTMARNTEKRRSRCST